MKFLVSKSFEITKTKQAFVEHYLDRLYYDEVAVTQHKWRGFEEQRNLAREKYGLVLTDSLLPGQTQDNELDVLQIMRLIHVFARTYHYNLNNQIFVQHESEGKNLNSINVDIIADSIRTHGIGIMNTTVNFTFQFLKQRFITFSQFLFDDHISGRLYKDGRFFKKVSFVCFCLCFCFGCFYRCFARNELL
jgi:WASH complex subunit 7